MTPLCAWLLANFDWENGEKLVFMELEGKISAKAV